MTKPSVVLTTCIVVVAAGALVLSAACGTTGARTGSETNFLRSCDASCGDGLSCFCGICTRLCSTNDECSSLVAGAECVADVVGTGDESCSAEEDAFCDKACTDDADCESLGGSFQCHNDRCRMPDSIVVDECPTTTLEIGENDRSVDVDGTTRNYLVHVPENFTGDAAVPLILDFHPLAGSPTVAAATSGYQELSEQEGFIVAYPEGIDAAWNIGPCCTESRDVDDVAFTRAVVEQISSEACIDLKRVYAVGAVMGGGMAYDLACNAADLVAAIAASSFDLLAEADQPCAPTEPVGVISFRWTDDAVVPYEGGAEPAPGLPGVTMNFLGAEATFERWAELDECAGSPSDPDANGCSSYSDCASGVDVTLCTVQGGAAGWGSAEDGWATLQRHSKP